MKISCLLRLNTDYGERHDDEGGGGGGEASAACPLSECTEEDIKEAEGDERGTFTRSVREGYVRALIKSSRHTVNHRRMTRAYYVGSFGIWSIFRTFCSDLMGPFQHKSDQWPIHVSDDLLKV